MENSMAVPQRIKNRITIWSNLVAQSVKCLPTMRETRVWSLGREDPLEKESATHSSIHAWKIPWTEEPGGLQSMGSQRVGHDWATSLHFFFIARLLAALLTKRLEFHFSSITGIRINKHHSWIKKDVLGLEESICENDYTTRSNLQIQCNPYQITNGIFSQN